MEISTILIVLIIGILAGVIGSLLGMGGGIIVTPFLTLIAGYDIKVCIGTCIIVVIATSSGSTIAYLKDKILNLRVAMFLEIFTALGAIIGAVITGLVIPQILYVIFALSMLYTCFNMVLKLKSPHKNYICKKSSSLALKLKLNSSYYDSSLKKVIRYGVTNVVGGSAIMFGAGLSSGMLGLGSGVFKVLAMDSVMKMPLKVSTSTSNLMMGVTAAASSIIFFINGQIVFDLTACITVGVLCGATIGSKIMPKIKPKYIRIAFVPVLLILAVSMFIKAFG